MSVSPFIGHRHTGILPPPRAPPPRPPFAHAATAGGILSYRDRVVGGGDNAIAQLAERQTVVVSSRYLLVTGSIPVGETFSFPMRHLFIILPNLYKPPEIAAAHLPTNVGRAWLSWSERWFQNRKVVGSGPTTRAAPKMRHPELSEDQGPFPDLAAAIQRN